MRDLFPDLNLEIMILFRPINRIDEIMPGE